MAGEILNRELFLYVLHREVERARRYQNFFCVLTLRLPELVGRGKGRGLQESYLALSNWLKGELRDSDVVGSLGNDQLGVLIPYADPMSGEVVRSRLEENLKYLGFKNAGYGVVIGQTSFPMDGTVTEDLVRKVLEKEAA